MQDVGYEYINLDDFWRRPPEADRRPKTDPKISARVLNGSPIIYTTKV